MKKKFIFVFTLLVFVFTSMRVNAATLGISASNRNPNTGSTVTITVNASGLIGKFSVTSSNPSVLSGGTLSDWIEDGTKRYQFTAKSKGTATITVLALDVADSSGTPFSGSKAISITVGEAATNNYLSSLSVDNATLTPEFNKDVLSYTAELEAGTTKAKINASKADSKASVSGVGEFDVEEGDNNFEVTVTAENGATRVYNLNIVVKEFDPIEVKIGKKTYTVQRNDKKITPPDGYEKTTIKIQDKEVPAYKSKLTKYTLVVLKDSKGNQAFYIYKDGKYTKYQEYTFSQIRIVPLKLTKIPAGYVKTQIKLKDDKVTAYKMNNSSNYYLIYGMNLETGKQNMYMYEKGEGTLQIYNKNMNNKLLDRMNLYKICIISLGSAVILLLVICICLMVKTHKYKKIVHRKKTKKKDQQNEVVK